MVLYYYEELTMKEIAAVMELPESQVSQMHPSIVIRLKAYIQRNE
ncbi:MAG: sigma factor-like helix-turn-helix DNA-binding protein [Planctomycetota bacterium]